jgi:acetoin utilization deacetylase AcuC-like enzyme
MTFGLLLSPLFERHETRPFDCDRGERMALVAEAILGEGLEEGAVSLEPRQATLEQVLRCHSQRHIDYLLSLHDAGGGVIDADTVMGKHSWPTALLAAGSVIGAAEAVARGELQRAFVACRPPGHHATRNQAMGFCLLNSIAIATQHLLDEGLVERPCIVDFDVHHGNGTQEIFDADPRVIFVSTHQSHIFPGTGWPEEIGRGGAAGTKFNLPFPSRTPPKEILSALGKTLEEVASRFTPDIYLVSAGFDGHHLDPISSWILTEQDYREITRMIVDAANRTTQGRVVSVLEGGYHPASLQAGVAAHVGEMRA